MYAPTVSNLRFLAEQSTAEGALRAAASVPGAVTPARPVKVQVDLDGKVVKRVLPGDPGYDAAPDYSVVR